MLAEYLTTREKMVILVDSLIHTVSKEPNHFYVLVKVLEEKRQHNAIAGLLLQSHGKYRLDPHSIENKRQIIQWACMDPWLRHIATFAPVPVCLTEMDPVCSGYTHFPLNHND